MFRHRDLTDAQLFRLLRAGETACGGNARLGIYGRLDCASGRRMRREQRVFFASVAEARERGYRPCGTCLRPEYRLWKASRTS
jgi:methylphosphotriester-DNA--protein-cysteine methyltransferase